MTYNAVVCIRKMLCIYIKIFIFDFNYFLLSVYREIKQSDSIQYLIQWNKSDVIYH